MKYIAMIRATDGSIVDVEVAGEGIEVARAVVPEGGLLLSVRQSD